MALIREPSGSRASTIGDASPASAIAPATSRPMASCIRACSSHCPAEKMLHQPRFIDIWKHSSQLAEVRSIRTPRPAGVSDCAHVSGCSRCPGLAYMEGTMRGPSTADCEKSYARTAFRSANVAPVGDRAGEIKS